MALLGAQREDCRLVQYHYWCSDRAYYNQLVDISQQPHYCTGEHLIYCSPYYNYGLFLDFNTKPVRYNGGSAIFVHCKGPESHTEGCIAVSQSNMKRIIRTVGPGSRVLIYKKEMAYEKKMADCIRLD